MHLDVQELTCENSNSVVSVRARICEWRHARNAWLNSTTPVTVIHAGLNRIGCSLGINCFTKKRCVRMWSCTQSVW